MLVDFVTHERPQAEAGDDRLRKYPRVCCELLCAQAQSISDALFQHEELLDSLWAFLDQHEPPLSPQLVSYCVRIIQSLVSQKITASVAYLRKKERAVPRLVARLTSPGVPDLVTKLAACEDEPALRWLCDAGFIAEIIALLSSADADAREIAAQLLLDIIDVSTGPIADYFKRADFVDSLMRSIAADTEDQKSSFLFALPPMTALIKKYASGSYSDAAQLAELPALFGATATHLPDIDALLGGKGANAEFRLSFGTLTPPLGLLRLKLVEYILAFARSNHKCVLDVLAISPTLLTVLDLFFTYLWNSLLHQVVQDLLLYIFRSGHLGVILHVLVDGKLLARIVEAQKASEEETKISGLPRGYMGALRNISAEFESLVFPASGTADPRLVELAKSTSGWSDFVSGPLAERRQIESQLLGGRKPSAGMGADDFDAPVPTTSDAARNFLAGFDDDEPDEGDSSSDDDSDDFGDSDDDELADGVDDDGDGDSASDDSDSSSSDDGVDDQVEYYCKILRGTGSTPTAVDAAAASASPDAVANTVPPLST
eukprot:TRINITY_DN7078_c0_g1_i1.p1 TRINITY_DN7078_c0_g1~~TRINITY_DN7078_c0_g1_i1.p1  ORF type:complete len:625 (-),score=200.24 TRINITY_DN7078_c0_g1_i1:105-1739(-)